ncbi:MAG: agmatinase family protein [Candidatus Pacebacteria bacterium]|nr:agmatinase family protein [Candidatus Paceibacterota bacterium]
MKTKTKPTKEEIIAAFDHNNVANPNAGPFGIPIPLELADYVLLSAPWEVTVSSGHGTLNGPKRILEGSMQVDLGSSDVWKKGIAAIPVSKSLMLQNKMTSAKMRLHLKNTFGEKTTKDRIKAIDSGCERMVYYIENIATKYLAMGKTVILLGGDHSTPLGLMRAYKKKYKGEVITVLHIDAHFDLRKAYLGAKYSHASIMRNMLESSRNFKLVSVGIRDYGDDEVTYAVQNKDRVTTFYDKRDIFEAKARGTRWNDIVKRIVAACDDLVYLSFDVDGMERQYCPATGTPVPGGLSSNEVASIVSAVAKEKTIVGFDINETGDGEWDGFVSAKLLYHFIDETDKSKKNFRG